jgi:hypothetical protein
MYQQVKHNNETKADLAQFQSDVSEMGVAD